MVGLRMGFRISVKEPKDVFPMRTAQSFGGVPGIRELILTGGTTW